MSFLAPKEGDLVLFCQHADVSKEYIDISATACKDQPFHWYFIAGSDVPTVTRHTPNGKKDRTINWLARCNACYLESAEAPATMMGKESLWIGPPPVIRND